MLELYVIRFICVLLDTPVAAPDKTLPFLQRPSTRSDSPWSPSTTYSTLLPRCCSRSRQQRHGRTARAQAGPPRALALHRAVEEERGAVAGRGVDAEDSEQSQTRDSERRPLFAPVPGCAPGCRLGPFLRLPVGPRAAAALTAALCAPQPPRSPPGPARAPRCALRSSASSPRIWSSAGATPWWPTRWSASSSRRSRARWRARPFTPSPSCSPRS